MGRSSNYNVWDNVTYSTSEIKRGNDYTILTPDSDWERLDKIISDSNNFCMEFDVNYTISSSTSSLIRFYDSNSSKVGYKLSSLGLQSEQWYHIKLERNGDTIIPTIDGVTLTNQAQTFTGPINKFSLITIVSETPNMKYKNFIFYYL